MNIETIMKNPNSFSIYIEQESKNSNTTLFDVLLTVCEKNNIEYDSVHKMISQSLKEKLYNEALKFNLLKEKRSKISLENFI